MEDNSQAKLKTFSGDFFKILDLLKSGKNFAFSKYADGEYAILRDKRIKNCDGWMYDPIRDQKSRYDLMASFRYSDPGYYVGISCPCCVPREHVRWMRENVGSDADHLTWANLFVNANYKLFKDHFIPEFAKREVILVASARGSVESLPFPVEEHYGISRTAWRNDYDLINILLRKDYHGKLFLFCAGPLGNMLAHRLWYSNKDNTYLDIGSTLNPWLVGKNRGYLKGGKTLYKTCIW